MLADTDAREGDWLVALVQDKGRGRQGRHWQSQKGNFLASTVVEIRPDDPMPTTLSLAAGLALIEAVDEAVAGQPLLLKWPNDLLLDGTKLAGILLERSAARVVAGFGVNLAHAPDLPDRPTASLSGKISPEEFAPLLAASFARMLCLWRTADPAQLAKAWQERAHPVGSDLRVNVAADQIVSGRFDGIEHDGALRLRTVGGVEIIRAGDVSL